jgi:hypothetical protein
LLWLIFLDIPIFAGNSGISPGKSDFLWKMVTWMRQGSSWRRDTLLSKWSAVGSGAWIRITPRWFVGQGWLGSICFVFFLDIWLVVWNIFLFFHILGIIIPTDSHIFQRGGSTTNQICSEFLSILFSRHLRGRFDQPESAATGGLRPTAAVPKMSCVSPIPMQLLDILPREGGGKLLGTIWLYHVVSTFHHIPPKKCGAKELLRDLRVSQLEVGHSESLHFLDRH